MKKIPYFLVIAAVVLSALGVQGQDELETRVYEFGGGDPFELWDADQLAPDPFLDPVPEGEKPKAPLVTPQKILTTVGMNFGIGSSANFDPVKKQLILTTTPDEMLIAETYFEKVWKGHSEKMINVIYEMIEVDHDEFSDWLFENRLIGDDTPLRKELQKWVKDKRGSILETTQVVARSGQRAKIEGVEEFIYPTEMDPPEIPNQVSLSGNTVSPITAQTPTAFETRNMGLTFEVDPVLGADNFTVDLNVSPGLTKLKGHSEWGPDVDDGFFIVKMPTFHTVRTTTQITVVDGRYTLISTARPMESSDPKRKNPLVLNFVRADISYKNSWSRVDKPSK